ncbi:AAA family ATPase [Candidatus Woesearchaeota archaeon]|nr:AAA family ATPase [Candidatus Woesearchaeota archaeon]
MIGQKEGANAEQSRSSKTGSTKQGKIISVISVKGGVGKTTTTLNLGAALSQHFGQNVLVVDANFSAPNLGLHVGIVDPEYTLNEVLADEVPVSQALVAHSSGMHILTASLKDKRINPYKLRNRIIDLKSQYDFIIVDSSPAMNEETLSAIMAADEILVVTSPDYPTLSCTMKAIQIAKDKKTPISGLIVNKHRRKNFELNLSEIEKSTEVPILAVIPDDLKVLESLAHTAPVSTALPNANSSVQYLKLAASLTGNRYDDPRFRTKLMNLFGGKVSKAEINRTLYAQEIRKQLNGE